MLFGASTESKINLPTKPGEHAALQAQTTTTTTRTLPAPGHGRHGAHDYSDSPGIKVEQPSVKSGDPCPLCRVGKVYAWLASVVVKMIGQSPLAATVYELERLRCRLGDATAALPQALAVRNKALKAGLTPVARAINTSGIVAVLVDHKVALFSTI